MDILHCLTELIIQSIVMYFYNYKPFIDFSVSICMFWGFLYFWGCVLKRLSIRFYLVISIHFTKAIKKYKTNFTMFFFAYSFITCTALVLNSCVHPWRLLIIRMRVVSASTFYYFYLGEINTEEASSQKWMALTHRSSGNGSCFVVAITLNYVHFLLVMCQKLHSHLSSKWFLLIY